MCSRLPTSFGISPTRLLSPRYSPMTRSSSSTSTPYQSPTGSSLSQLSFRNQSGPPVALYRAANASLSVSGDVRETMPRSLPLSSAAGVLVSSEERALCDDEGADVDWSGREDSERLAGSSEPQASRSVSMLVRARARAERRRVLIITECSFFISSISPGLSLALQIASDRAATPDSHFTVSSVAVFSSRVVPGRCRFWE